MGILDRGEMHPARHCTRGELAKRSWALVAAAAISAVSPAAMAQMRGGHAHGEAARKDRSEQGPDTHGKQNRLPADPYAALERELPSLQADLRLALEQAHAWRPFERAVRAIAEINRGQQRRLMSLGGDAGQQMSAAALLAWLGEKARARAEAAADLQRHFEALYGSLGDEQRRIVDRRVMLSQSDPLGS